MPPGRLATSPPPAPPAPPPAKPGPASADSGELGRKDVRTVPLGSQQAPTLIPIRMNWIEFSLSRDDGKPAAGVKYRLKTPAGEIREGVTDARGIGRMTDVGGRGTCEVDFLDLRVRLA